MSGAAALSDERGVEGHGSESPAGQFLGVQSGTLFLYCSKRSGYSNSGQFSGKIPGQIQVAGQLDSIAVMKLHFFPGDMVSQGKGISVVF